MLVLFVRQRDWRGGGFGGGDRCCSPSFCYLRSPIFRQRRSAGRELFGNSGVLLFASFLFFFFSPFDLILGLLIPLHSFSIQFQGFLIHRSQVGGPAVAIFPVVAVACRVRFVSFTSSFDFTGIFLDFNNSGVTQSFLLSFLSYLLRVAFQFACFVLQLLLLCSYGTVGLTWLHFGDGIVT